MVKNKIEPETENEETEEQEQEQEHEYEYEYEHEHEHKQRKGETKPSVKKSSEEEQQKKLIRYEQTFWESLGSPKHILAPMVDFSELPFRLLCKEYNCHLGFTPMLNAKIFVQCAKYRESNFTTCNLDKPVIAQFCGNNYEILLKAIELIKENVSAVDLNFGCPQQIAKKGNYGSFLLNQQNVIPTLVYNITNNTNFPITCKIRKIDKHDYQKTLNLCYDLEQRNIKAITVHGRTKEEKGTNTKECDYEIIKIIKERINVPIIANGSIEFFEDVQKCLDYTKADAVMCAEIMLENPHFFSNRTDIHILDVANRYYNIFLQYETNPRYLKNHFFRMLFRHLQIHTDLRDELNKCRILSDYEIFLKTINQKRDQGILSELPQPNPWYRRHRKELY